jgi:glycerophosphoryl diester phosphodiesterase
MPTSLTHAGRTVSLTCHMAVLTGRHRPNSRAAIQECLAAGADRIEVDIHSLEGGDFIVSHDRHLEDSTTGAGALGNVTADDVRAVRYRDDPGDRPCLLSEVIELAGGGVTQLQLDLKDWRLLSAARVGALLEVISPVHDRVIVSTGQDWNLRRLHAADAALALGFDPGHYLDWVPEGAEVLLPRRTGAYGYRDEHPLAIGRIESTVDYLRERMAMLVGQAPYASEQFLYYRMMLQMLDDGFNVIDWLHERGIEVTAWTPDYRDEGSVAALARLIEAGVDRITTNTIPAWIDALGEEREPGVLAG